MGSDTSTQLITVAATLSGVVLTLVANAYLERHRARDTRELERMRLASEQGRWLRDERMKAYAGLSIVGEDALQFIRSELPMLIDPRGAGRREEAEGRWRSFVSNSGRHTIRSLSSAPKMLALLRSFSGEPPTMRGTTYCATSALMLTSLPHYPTWPSGSGPPHRISEPLAFNFSKRVGRTFRAANRSLCRSHKPSSRLPNSGLSNLQ
jgi:hypothetical protein